MPKQTIFVVFAEFREQILGRIVLDVDGVYDNEDKALARVKKINNDHDKYPGMVAWVEERPFGAMHRQRHAEGRRQGKLTPEMIREARERTNAGESGSEIARDMGVAPSTLNRAMHEWTRRK